LNVSPNPTQGNVSISFSDNSMVSSVRVLDINGREVLAIDNSDESTLSFDMSVFKSGVYFVEVTNEAGSQTRKIIKE